ncbi:MAG TPA: chemotaxis protein CheB [Gemmatimonadales bacterium]|jgi:two-component system CheB/CheR fusion protein|nr:chemotaxis protein CheB [Gemmatimonadales bacterium]
MPRKRAKPAERPSVAASSPAQTEAESPERTPSLSFPVVGIGASAGGLEAFKEMLQALPVDTGMAYVLVPHLDPSHRSMLADILGRVTEMPVLEATDRMAVAPNHVYVLPPGKDMVLVEGRLRLSPRSKTRTIHRPIDLFLRSLGEDQLHRSIAVILSGTANDGTLGCAQIKAAGGISFAQDDTAEHDSMPKNAAAAGCIDFVLPPAEIARQLAEIGRHPELAGVPAAGERTDRADLSGILDLLHQGRGIDFTHYKRSTLYRRITRRMVLHRLEGLQDYQRMLLKDPSELEALYQDILISVTSFFRNPESFEAIKAEVLPRLTRDRSRHDPVRIWVLGCSTGEESYSMAISFAEFAEASGRQIPVQVFASDLNDAGIEKARAGVYGKGIEDDVSPERLRRFFTEVDGGYRIAKSIRDMVVFASHNVLTDPPFSHIDLITCRNVLIYLDPILQQRLIPVLHYALNAGGYLWLGNSETVGPHRELFDLVDPKHKIYSRKPGAPHPGVGISHATHPGKPVPRRDTATVRETAGGLLGSQREADRLVLTRYAPAGVLVNSDFEILQFRGDTSPFLMPAPGRASLNLLKMLREGLLVGVRGALQKAKRTESPVREANLKLVGAGSGGLIDVEVIPVRGASLSETCYLVLFVTSATQQARTRRAKASQQRGASEQGELEQENVRLTQELAATREYLQSVIEQHEAANEELQSANEEVQSTNEELQSINEELETSKEEIESSNEELATVNEELHNRNLELIHSNNDLVNLLGSVQLAIVMLGPDLRIRRFTPAAERLLNLIATDAGRPITDIKLNIEVPDLEQRVLDVINSVQPAQLETRDRRGRWFLLRLRPYRTEAGAIEGAVLVLVDVDELKRAEAEVRAGVERLRIVQDRAPIGIREVDLDGRYLHVNDRFCEITGYSREELLRLRFQDITHPDDVAANEEGYRQTLAGTVPSYRMEKRYLRKDGRTVWVELHGTVVRDAAGVPQFGVGFEHDISERKRAEQALLESEARFRSLAETAPVLIWVSGLEGPEYLNRRFREFFGLPDGDRPDFDWLAHIHPEDCDPLKTSYVATLSGRGKVDDICRIRRADGEYRWIKLIGAPRFTASGELLGYVGTGLDVTDLKQAEQELRDADRAKNEFLAMLAHELRNPLAPLRNVIHLLGTPGASFEPLRGLMDRQIQTLARLIDDLLDVSRITQGKLQIRSEPVELGELLRRSIEAAQPGIERYGQTLTLAGLGEPAYVQADVVRLDQVFGNLLTNASKFTPEGGRIEVRLELVELGGERPGVEVRVHDNGSGMDAATLATVFEPFTQGERRIDRARGGLGLGLTLVRKLVELHGGTVTASSPGPGKGSEFAVRLPLAPAGTLPGAAASPVERRRQSRDARRILVVDDNADAGDSLAMLLRSVGHQVEVSHDGAAAVDLATVFRPEFVLLDVGLPGKDGYEVARELRQRDETRAATLIGVSGYGQEEDRRRAREAGFDHYFTKPMDFSALQELLRARQKPASS